MRLAALILALALATPAVAQDYNVDVGPDALTVDPAAKAKHRRGRRLVSGEVTLEQPIVDAGRVINRMSVMQEWDCHASRYRVVRKTFRTDDGLFVHTDPADEPWTTVTRGGPGWETLKRACPGVAEPEPAGVVQGRPGPQVVTMPAR